MKRFGGKADEGRMHLEWVDALHRVAVPGAGRAIRAETEAEAERAGLAHVQAQLAIQEADLVAMREAAASTARMANLGPLVTGGYGTLDNSWARRQQEAALTRQIAVNRALVTDFERRLEDWISGKPLPAETPMKPNAPPEGELTFDEDQAIRKVYRNAVGRL